MNATRRSASSSDVHEDNGSSEFEKTELSHSGLDEEKTIGLDGSRDPAIVDGDDSHPKRGRISRRPSSDSRSLKTIRSHHSRAGGDGYTCFDAEPAAQRHPSSKPGVVAEQPYLVTWDGDADPENPRSMGKLRRWVIVLICSASSLCV